jgi:Mg-chelatase subunit ChlD
MSSWTAPDWWVDFDAPHFLLLLLIVLPAVWLIGRRSLHALSTWRSRSAMGLRLAVATMLVVALAEPNWLTLVRRLTVLFLVDASDSIQRDELDHALAYVNAASRQRDRQRGDRAGVVVFGRDATVEVPPIDQPWQLAEIESVYDPRFTNLEAAMQQAAATFPADSSKRVVILSDGNENRGRARQQAAQLHGAGIGIDCVPISYERQGDVMVEKIAVPADIRQGTPFSLRVVLENLTPDRKVLGKLRITRELGGAQQLVANEPIMLDPGKRVFSITQELDDAGMATYEARFLPDDPAYDARSENNVASGFCRVSGQGHVLVIEDVALPGRFDNFVELLRNNDIKVTVRDTRRPFDHLADLQQFDTVVLADVARVAGDGPADLTQITDRQIHDLVQNTEHFGCGLVVLGGPNSFGAGGWANTELEKALPVDFQIDSAKVEAVGALVLVIDSSGSMSGPKIAWSKAAAIAASQMLGKRDYLGVVSFDSEARWIVPVQRNGTPLRTQARIDRLGAGGGTNMMPALEQAYRAIHGANASLKHVVVLTDGQTPKEGYQSLVTTMRGRGITTTGVAIGNDADRVLLSDIGRRGGGRFYHVLSPNAIPRIFMREARRVAMPLIFEDRGGIPIQIVTSGELLSGIAAPPPSVTGYVLTTVKQDPLVEVLLSTPRQPRPNSTILASWQYGLGRAIALTTDAGERWAADWPAWSDYEKFMLQLVRWSMRNHQLNDQLAMTAEVRDGAIEIVVNAMDRDDAHWNYLNFAGTVVLPSGEPQSVVLSQVAPGRYVANVPADAPGNYFLAISGGGRAAPLRAAVNVAPTAESRDLASYDGFLAELAEGTPKGGQPGRLIQAPGGIADTEGLLRTNVFRPDLAPAQNRETMWPAVLLIASVVFVGDVFCRRVLIGFEWLPALVVWVNERLRFGEVGPASSGQPIERLKRSKSHAVARYDASRGAMRFEPTVETARSPETTSAVTARSVTDAQAESESLGASAASPDISDDESTPAGFTSRLLEAKRRAHEPRRPRD